MVTTDGIQELLQSFKQEEGGHDDWQLNFEFVVDWHMVISEFFVHCYIPVNVCYCNPNALLVACEVHDAAVVVYHNGELPIAVGLY